MKCRKPWEIFRVKSGRSFVIKVDGPLGYLNFLESLISARLNFNNYFFLKNYCNCSEFEEAPWLKSKPSPEFLASSFNLAFVQCHLIGSFSMFAHVLQKCSRPGRAKVGSMPRLGLVHPFQTLAFALTSNLQTYTRRLTHPFRPIYRFHVFTPILIFSFFDISS